MEQPILQVEHLTKFFSVGPHAEVHAVDDVNFTLRRGRTFGLVGESGCGKSSCARTIIRIYEPSQGKIIFNGQDIAHLKPRQMQPVRRNMQMIFTGSVCFAERPHDGARYHCRAAESPPCLQK